ncbi:10111_t:CDS:1, partial [Acaulospora colombiana]
MIVDDDVGGITVIGGDTSTVCTVAVEFEPVDGERKPEDVDVFIGKLENLCQNLSKFELNVHK